MQNRWIRGWLAAAVFSLLLGGGAALGRLDAATPAYAQGATALSGAEAAKKPETFMDYWRQGGTTMWPLLATAVWATAVAIEMILKLRMRYACPPGIVQQIDKAIRVKDYQKAWRIGSENPTVFTRIFCAAMEKLPNGREAFDTAAIEAASSEANAYRNKNAYINLNATISPLLGLFGTISGMVGAFNAMAYSGAVGDPTKLAGDIGEALITTYGGLVVAIPALCIYYILSNRIKTVMEYVQSRLNVVFDAIDFDDLPPDLVIVTQDMRSAALAGGKGAAGPVPAKARTGAAPKAAAAPMSAAAPELVACPNCQKQVAVGSKVCPHCNAELAWE